MPMISTIKQPFGKNNSQCYRIGLRRENDVFIFVISWSTCDYASLFNTRRSILSYFIFRLARRPGNSTRRLCIFDADINSFRMRQTAFHDEIVARNFEFQIRPNSGRFRKLDSRASIGKIDNCARQTAAVARDNDCRFEYRPSPELPSLRPLINRQDTLASIFEVTIARITCRALKTPFRLLSNWPVGLHLNLYSRLPISMQSLLFLNFSFPGLRCPFSKLD